MNKRIKKKKLREWIKRVVTVLDTSDAVLDTSVPSVLVKIVREGVGND